ncbi:uncharacterized protein LOC133889407 [Phragmites australis]|uniref:uncharacterized protein LOC133889407 n=1 Tax=Phragmites australis TaxID=29695 RepID=UPI002D76CA3C|nr:uncharacterized protein LOC133889407 [Phragmites australis]
MLDTLGADSASAGYSGAAAATRSGLGGAYVSISAGVLSGSGSTGALGSGALGSGAGTGLSASAGGCRRKMKVSLQSRSGRSILTKERGKTYADLGPLYCHLDARILYPGPDDVGPESSLLLFSGGLCGATVRSTGSGPGPSRSKSGSRTADASPADGPALDD